MVEECKPIFFDSRHIGEPEDNYVCWLDVMGTHNQMLRSLPTSANFIFKLQCAVLESHDGLPGDHGVRLYPVMDGVYITSPRRAAMQYLIGWTLRRLTETFLREDTMHHRFLVRGAIAYGPVFHGRTVQRSASYSLHNHPQERDSVLLGLPMAQAYAAERLAPPYGIAIDASARAFAPRGDMPFRFIWWDWYSSVTPTLDSAEMLNELESYFEWHEKHTYTSGYERERIKHHQELAREYFDR